MYPNSTYFGLKVVPIYSEPQKVGNMGLGGFVLGSPILYLKGMRILMFQLSGFYYRYLSRAKVYTIWVHGPLGRAPG